jgi:hypothetical protein
MMIFFEIGFIVCIVLLQLYTFFDVRGKMRELRSFFPKDFDDIKVVKYFIPRNLLKDNMAFASFINGINKTYTSVIGDNDDEKEEVEVLVLDDLIKASHHDFNEVIESTNAYLCKNKGASADFNILQDICDRHIQRLDNSISNLINVPLYIGLAGTFVGIIIGLSGIDFTSASGAIQPESINQLLNGVIAAMVASLFGLGLTVWNTALNYKPAVYQNDTDKNNYYDFIQRELLPVLNIGMAGSLTSFRSVLNNFITKFGDNIGEYHDTAELLNDNLSKQQLVLEEINKLSLTRTSTKIAETFVNLKNSSEQLKMFLDYQISLNQNVTEANKVVGGLNETLNSFKSFNKNLDAIAKNVNSSIELQRQFKDMLELHFPTIKDHREVWRGQVDELNTDIKGVYRELNRYFQESTSIIQTFIKNNENFFTGLNEIQNAIKVFVKSAEIQNEQFKTLNIGMLEIRHDFKQSQQSNYELNRELVEAIKSLTLKISKFEINSSN